MNRAELFVYTGILLFSIGVYGLIVYPHLLRKALAVNIMSTGVFMFLAAVAYRGADRQPDPVPHALVLTGIVVAVCATAFMMAIALSVHYTTGSATLEDERKEKE